MKTKQVSGSKLRLLCISAIALFSVSGLKAQVTIGSGADPAAGAVLQIKEFDAMSDNQTATKGMLYPRVILTDKNELYPMFSSTDPNYVSQKAAIQKEHIGLTVYNIKESGDFIEGIHTWNGTAWKRIENSDVLQASVTSLLCSSISINQNSYTTGVEFETTVKVPYLGGNGGSYSGTAPSALNNGLQIERIAGKLNIGGGEVMYRVFGTPTVTSPSTTTFPIEFLEKTCNVVVGSGATSLQLKSLTNDVLVNVVFNGGNPASVNELPFEEIEITESGSYAFSLRLYGRMTWSGTTNGSAGRQPFYIYLQKNGSAVSNIIDAAEIDIVTVDQSHQYNDYSYSVTLGGSFQAGDKVYIGMNKPDNGPTWTLKKGDASGSISPSPVRTSLIYWKL